MGKSNKQKFLSTTQKVFPFFFNVKSTVTTFLKKGVKYLYKTVLLYSFVGFIALPFLHNYINFILAHILWLPTCFINILLFSKYYYEQKKLKKYTSLEFCETHGYFIFSFVCISFFILNYYEINYIWRWIIAVVALVYIPNFFHSFFVMQIKKVDSLYKEADQIRINVLNNTLFYWILVLFYISIFNNWLPLIFIFGCLAVIVEFYNIAHSFLSENKFINRLLSIEFVLCLSIIVYLIYIVPDTKLQTIILNITTATLGGLITLIGVAWTIKRSNEERKADVRNHAKPFLCITDKNDSKIDNAFENAYYLYQNSDKSNKLKFRCVCCLKNSEKCIFYLNKLKIKNTFYYPRYTILINKEEEFSIFVAETDLLNGKENSIKLYITDINCEERILQILYSPDELNSKIIEVEK